MKTTAIKDGEDVSGNRVKVKIVKNSGGIPVIAHPGLNFRGKEDIVPELLDNGAMGLEVFNNYHTPPQVTYFATVTQDRNAIITCGSDFHGKTKPKINIGDYVVDEEYREYLNTSVEWLTWR